MQRHERSCPPRHKPNQFSPRSAFRITDHTVLVVWKVSLEDSKSSERDTIFEDSAVIIVHEQRETGWLQAILQ